MPGISGGGRRLLLALVWLWSRLVALALFVTVGDRAVGAPEGDLRLYWLSGSNTPVDGAVPDLTEYPGLALAVIEVAAHASPFALFVAIWLSVALTVDAAVTWLLAKSSAEGAWLWTLTLPLLGVVSWFRFDILVAASVVVAVLARHRRAAISGIALAVASLFKIWPVALAPLLGPGPRITRWAGVALLTVALVTGADLLLRGGQVVGPFVWQQARGLQIESVLATPWMIGRAFTGVPELSFEYRAWQVVGGVPAVTIVGFTILAALAIWAVVRLWHQNHGWVWEPRAQSVALAMLSVACVATGKVFSPQYVLWFLPAVAIALPWLSRGRLVIAVTLVTAALSQAIFPWLYGDLLEGALTATTVLAARNLLVVALLVLLILETHNATRDGSWADESVTASR